ncbi:LEA domain-containing protein [Schizosaccharomyces cryophilus OY26]|uniref:LEA domain-containing protein n=1 Tax=Schizosaccharomyces cryophilus (strain OY26 / ATCC MYA-4695 / CBS 11777 / NBRC 106824 / NRRL Y48691) TaxID=653667 RepID=S9X3G6_SCHCR|nr:LEA domain-containing protein [Schizosaccharomyces cryophilus OY26]EPY51647.1 LEA domain-containing protein [Schizosaccharomyces cryophilus OY26]
MRVQQLFLINTLAADVSAIKTWLDEHSVPYGTRSSPAEFRDFLVEHYESLIPSFKSVNDFQRSSWLGKKTNPSYFGTAKHKINQASHKIGDAASDAKDTTSDVWEDQKSRFFDAWNDSQLRAFLARYSDAFAPKEKKGLLEKLSPASLRKLAVKEYKRLGSKLGETGDWVYDTWSDNELRTWLHNMGVPIQAHESRHHILDKVKKTVSEKLDSGKPIIESTKKDATKKAGKAGHYVDKVSEKAEDSVDYASGKITETGERASESLQEEADRLHEASKGKGRIATWWSESGLKAYLDARGIPAYQPSALDKLWAMARRQYYLRTNGYKALKEKTKEHASSVTDTASGAASDASTAATDAFHAASSNAGQLKDEIKGAGSSNAHVVSSKTGDLKHKASGVSSYASDKFEQGSEIAKAQKEAASSKARELVDETVLEKWKDSKLREFLYLRGVPVPKKSNKQQLIDKVRKHFNKGTIPHWAVYFNTLSSKELNNWIQDYKKYYHGKLHPSKDREHLVQNACNIYRSLTNQGDKSVLKKAQKKFPKASLSEYTDWSNEDLKSALSEYGEPPAKPFNRRDAIEKLKHHDLLFYGPVLSEGQTQGIFGFLQRAASYLGFGKRPTPEKKLEEDIVKAKKDLPKMASKYATSASDYVESNAKKFQTA